MQTDMNFNFTNKDEPVGKDNADILVGITCIIALIFTVFYILIPEKNIEKSGRELERFHQAVNVEWIDSTFTKGYSVEERVQKAQNTFGKENINEKVQFLIYTHSILMEQKNSEHRDIFLSQVMLDRKDILNYLTKQFNENKTTDFSCSFADCKDKEYRVTQEKLQTIKLFNLKLNNYYLDLINLYEKDKKNKVKVQDIKFNVLKALDEKERKIYSEIS